MCVAVQRDWLLQYPDGRVALFATNPYRPGEPPTWVPVLRVLRQRESWWNLRLVRRSASGRDESTDYAGGTLLAEYELARTDGRVLTPWDIVPEALSLHDEIVVLKRACEARARSGVSLTQELEQIAKRLPASYRSVGVRVYNPVRPAWKLQLAWTLQLLLAAFLCIFLFATLATGWQHIEAQGTDAFLRAYLIPRVSVLLILALAAALAQLAILAIS